MATGLRSIAIDQFLTLLLRSLRPLAPDFRCIRAHSDFSTDRMRLPLSRKYSTSISNSDQIPRVSSTFFKFSLFIYLLACCLTSNSHSPQSLSLWTMLLAFGTACLLPKAITPGNPRESRSPSAASQPHFNYALPTITTAQASYLLLKS